MAAKFMVLSTAADVLTVNFMKMFRIDVLKNTTGFFFNEVSYSNQ